MYKILILYFVLISSIIYADQNYLNSEDIYCVKNKAYTI
jgi:hypothetical protein